MSLSTFLRAPTHTRRNSDEVDLLPQVLDGAVQIRLVQDVGGVLQTGTDVSSAVTNERASEQSSHDGVVRLCVQTYIERVRSEPQMTPKALAGHIRCVTTHHVSSKRLRLLREAQVPIVIVTGTRPTKPKLSPALALTTRHNRYH